MLACHQVRGCGCDVPMSCAIIFVPCWVQAGQGFENQSLALDFGLHPACNSVGDQMCVGSRGGPPYPPPVATIHPPN